MKKSLTKLSKKIKDLPDSPGVYQFLDSKRRIIYVGKAKRLKKRVASYFQAGRARDSRLELLRDEVRDIKIIKASSEAEALIYEAGLIKDYSPRFNVDLKDDKSYPFLKLTVQEKYPRIFVSRRKLNDGAMYYGPYVNVKLLKEALSFMKKVFTLRSCRSLHKKVCLEYHIGQCDGPCEKLVTEKEYAKKVQQLKKFLEGKKDDLIREMQKEMKKFSGSKEYEKALIVKNRIEALTAVQQLHNRSQYPIFGELDELKNVLDLKNTPMAIECFDISNTSGQEAVGSMVKFVAGKSKKAEYRRFRIKEVEGIDDYSMIREVVKRRYSRLLEENRAIPDVVLIDGGKGHLAAARAELASLGLKDLAVASIAKEFNHLYVVSKRDPIRLSPGSRLLLLIQRVRDEAHRFAITYHRKLRSARKFDTSLRGIKGIGPAREKLLLDKLGGISRIRKASGTQLINAGIGKKTAKAIVKYFRSK